jgi:hypothetical protein
LLETGVAEDEVRSFLQLGQERERSLDCQEARQILAQLFGRPGAGRGIGSFIGQDTEPPEYYDELEALFFGWRAVRSEEDDETLFGDLPPAVADRARRVAKALEGQPASV